MADQPLYLGVFLTPESRALLLSQYPAKHPEVHADHMTIKFKPTLLEIANAPIGRKVKLVVTGIGHNKKVQAVLVSGIFSDNAFAHITLSVSREAGGTPSLSNDLFRVGPGYVEDFEDEEVDKLVFLDGTIDVFPRTITPQAQEI